MWDWGRRAEEDRTDRKVLTVQRTAEGPLRIAPGCHSACWRVVPFPWKHFSAVPDAWLDLELGGVRLHLCQPLRPFPSSHMFLPLPVWRKPPNIFIKSCLEQPHVVSQCLLNGVDLKLCSICSKKKVTDPGAPGAGANVEGIDSSFGLGRRVPGRAGGS